MPSSFARRLALASLVLALVPLVAACGSGDDDTGPTPTLGPPASSTGTLPTTPRPTVIPLANELARSAQFAVYLVGEGDTWDSIGAAFGVPAPTILADNKLSAPAPQPGQLLGIRMMVSGTGAIMPEASMQRAVPGTPILRPGQALQERFRGRIILHNVILKDDRPAGEGFGYSLVFWLADRPAFKGGTLDPDARAAELLFALTAGIGGPASPPDNIHVFQRGGITYTVQAASAAGMKPAEIAALLEPVVP